MADQPQGDPGSVSSSVERSAPAEGVPILSGTALTMSYRSGEARLTVLDGVAIDVRAGTSVSIRGESGCGKTTLLNLLAGLETPDRGSVRWGGQEIAGLARGELARRRAGFIGMVFQSFYLIPELDAAENVLMAARMRGKVGAAEKQRVRELLGRVGLATRGHHLPSQLSGGERQRVAVARALMNRPQVVLADEPTGNLDETTAEAVMDLLLAVTAEHGASLVLVTHNKDHAARTREQVFLSRHHLLPTGARA